MVDKIQKLCYKASMVSRGFACGRLKDIIVELEQRISAYKNRLQELKKTRKRFKEESATIEKYLELAEPLYHAEPDKAKLANLSSQIITDEKGARPIQVMDVTDQAREIRLGRSKYVGMSVPEAVHRILPEANRSMHGKELLQCLLQGGMQIKGPPSLRSPSRSRETNVSGKWALIPLKLWKKH